MGATRPASGHQGKGSQAEVYLVLSVNLYLVYEPSP